jgi:hypothetical protein
MIPTSYPAVRNHCIREVGESISCAADAHGGDRSRGSGYLGPRKLLSIVSASKVQHAVDSDIPLGAWVSTN